MKLSQHRGHLMSLILVERAIKADREPIGIPEIFTEIFWFALLLVFSVSTRWLQQRIAARVKEMIKVVKTAYKMNKVMKMSEVMERKETGMQKGKIEREKERERGKEKH